MTRVIACVACGAATFRAPVRSGALATWDARRVDRSDVEPVARRALIGLYVIGDDAMRPARVTDPGPYWRLHRGVCSEPALIPKRKAGG